jgi:hypothetical protein
MSLAPICILYYKHCNMMNNIEYVGFPGLGFQGKNFLCNVCICHCIFSILFLNICF